MQLALCPRGQRDISASEDSSGWCPSLWRQKRPLASSLIATLPGARTVRHPARLLTIPSLSLVVLTYRCEKLTLSQPPASEESFGRFRSHQIAGNLVNWIGVRAVLWVAWLGYPNGRPIAEWPIAGHSRFVCSAG